MLIAIPVYFLAFLIGSAFSFGVLVGLLAFVSFIFGIVLALFVLNYLLDKLIVTNKRVIYEDWQGLFRRIQHEAKFKDIQDIRTHETGFFSTFRIFDFGTLNIETAASRTSVVYKDCPDPEGVKHKIFSELSRAIHKE